MLFTYTSMLFTYIDVASPYLSYHLNYPFLFDKFGVDKVFGGVVNISFIGANVSSMNDI